MTTLTVYADTTDGYIHSENATYTTARAGSGLLVFTTEGSINVGQAAGYFCFQSFLQFDTSSVPDSASISDVVLAVDGILDSSDTDFVIEARTSDWGASLTTGDFVAGASLSALTLLASVNSSGFSTSYFNFTNNGLALIDAINKTGSTKMILCSAEQTNNSAPTGNEYITLRSSDTSGTTQDPKLTITYSATTGQSITGTMGALSGILNKRTTHTLSGTVGALTSSLVLRINKGLSGVISLTGGVTKGLSKVLTGVVGALSAIVSDEAVQLRTVSGTLGALTGALSTLFGKNLGGSISPTGSLIKHTTKSIAGSITSITASLIRDLLSNRRAVIKGGFAIIKRMRGGNGIKK